MIVLVMGVSGSGKSTIGRLLADSLRWDFVDADAFHPPENIAKMSRGTALSERDREPWLRALRNAVERWLSENRNIVLACSALTADHRRALIQDAKQVKVVYLKGTYDGIYTRLTQRRHFMPKELLASQFDTLEEPADALTVDAAWPPDTIVAHVRAHLNASPLPDTPRP